MYKFLAILTCFGISKSQNFFVVKKYIENDSEGHYYCITNSSFGLSWINEDNTDNIILQQGSTFISDSRGDFDWNLEDYPVPMPWSLQNSLNGLVNEVILDQRWENMKVIQTQPYLSKDFSNPTNVTDIVKNRTGDFVVPFSVRSNTADIIFFRDAHVKKRRTKLYWLNLQDGNKSRTTLTACATLVLTSDSCDTSENKLPPKQLPSTEKWTHFQIRKSNNLLTVIRINGSEHKEIIKFNNSDVSSISRMVIGGFRKKSIMWKIHKLEYMYTTERKEIIQIGPVINVGNHSICISMFVSMCQLCSLKLGLLSKDHNRSTILGEKKYHYQKTGWFEIKYLEDIKNKRVFLVISTINNSSDESFWAIDQIRKCQQNEQRMITSSEKAQCQLISDDDGIISTEEKLSNDDGIISAEEELSRAANTCSEKTIGSFCTPCSWILSENCGRVKICENYKTKTKCYESECKCENVDYLAIPSPSLPISVRVLVFIIVILFMIIFISIIIYILRKCLRSNSNNNNNNNINGVIDHSSNNNKEVNIPLINRKTYGNKDFQNHTDSIDVRDFSNHVKNSIKNESFKQEYIMIRRNATTVPYEEIYENLYFIDMHFSNDIIKKAYVVTKIPEQNKIDYFWQNVWKQNVEHIVLVDDIYSKKTSENYWAEKNDKLQCGNISVQIHLNEVFADYEYRKFILVNEEHNIKHVDQLRLITWSDNKPLNFLNLVPFFQIMSTFPLSSSSPILVHCRNGFEGTSFALLCDMCLRIAKKENTLNISQTLQKISDCSTKLMIAKVERYIMAHLLILEILTHIETSVRCDSFEKTTKTSFATKEVEDQKRFLQEIQWRDTIIEAINARTNSNYFRVTNLPITSDTMSLTSQNPLKITVVDGFRYPERFLVTQIPELSNTLNFWKLITEKNIRLIVLLNEISAQDFDFRPNEKQPLIEPLKSMCVKFERGPDLEFLDWVTVQLKKPHGDVLENQHVDIITMKYWPSATICPSNTNNFVKFCTKSERFSRKSSPIVVICSDGITASGLYVTMMYNMEKMKQEQVCDVCTSVRNMRFYCSQFVKHEEQFDFLWKAAVIYMQEFFLYDNFN